MRNSEIRKCMVGIGQAGVLSSAILAQVLGMARAEIVDRDCKRLSDGASRAEAAVFGK